MIPTFTALSKLSLPWKLWSVRVDLREHEDKILLRLSLVVSAIVGLVVVAFVVLTERLGVLLVTAGAVQRVLSPLVGSLVGGWLLFRFFPDARGSGIPQTRVALVLQKGVIGLRTVIGKFVCSSISLGSGVALGREGPSVHTNSPSMAYGTVYILDDVRSSGPPADLIQVWWRFKRKGRWPLRLLPEPSTGVFSIIAPLSWSAVRCRVGAPIGPTRFFVADSQ